MLARGFVMLGVVWALLGCAEQYHKQQAVNNSSSAGADSYYFRPCLEQKVKSPVLHALGGMLLSLRERGWEIEAVDGPRASIRAKACLLNERTNCAGMFFSFLNDGTARAYATSGSSVPREMRDDIKRWMVFLEQTYSTHRCAPYKTVINELSIYGITYPRQ